MKHIDLVLPDNAKNVTITFQLPDNEVTVNNKVEGVLNITPIVPASSHASNTIQKVLAIYDKYPNASSTLIATRSGTSIATVSAIKYVMKYAIPEIHDILRTGKTNASYCYVFARDHPVDLQRELIRKYGVIAIKEYANKVRQLYPANRSRNTINIF